MFVHFVDCCIYSLTNSAQNIIANFIFCVNLPSANLNRILQNSLQIFCLVTVKLTWLPLQYTCILENYSIQILLFFNFIPPNEMKNNRTSKTTLNVVSLLINGLHVCLQKSMFPSRSQKFLYNPTQNTTQHLSQQGTPWRVVMASKLVSLDQL